MGRCSVPSAALQGVRAVPVSVEVSVSSGLPGFSIVGLADTAVLESRERVRSAIKAAGFSMPCDRIVVNLAPSSMRKRGTGFDLAIALGVLIASGQLDRSFLDGRLFVGELSLEGEVRPIDGLLACAVLACRQGRAFVGPVAPDRLVAMEGARFLGIRSLAALSTAELVRMDRFPPRPCARFPDYREVAGNDFAKRALQIAAAGGHGVLMMGPPGSGKTMLASRLPSILPPLSEDEALESALVHSVAGEPIGSLLAGVRPFRSPHHSASSAGLIGGGSPLRPGEVSLAHNGVLFLDELAEFRTAVLQGIRQPMEQGEVCITRAEASVSFPARFMFVGASNPCPCGFFGDPERSCTCSESQVSAYQNRIGGPLLDRFDLQIDVCRVPPSQVMEGQGAQTSEQLRAGVLRAREFLSWRQARRPQSSGMKGLVEACELDAPDERFFVEAARRSALSGRGMARTLAVARTIADIDERQGVQMDDLVEALGFRLRQGCAR
ncbi:YifB family Mg chelatase-like AAA ATPase [Berryella wangjianweii]|nr:YifB family Mg chelatase-like AAA ATPase [Berryella wangjianweii]